MSKQEEDCPPVSNELCKARMQTLEEKINALKTAIYASATTITIVLTVVSVLLRVWKG